jgi:hypothetical protein
MRSGFVRQYFADRGYGYLRDTLNGADFFFHRTDFIGDPATIVIHATVQFVVLPYTNRQGVPATKAVNVKIVPAPADGVRDGK